MLCSVLIGVLAAPVFALHADQHNHAIGRFNHAGFSQAQHCTVTLIDERMAVSAQHCLIDGDVTEMHLLLGYDRGEWHEHLRPLSATTPNPSADIAVLCLDSASAARPVDVADRPVAVGEEVIAIGYGMPTVHVANETVCRVTAVYDQGAIELSCPLSPGDSGGPVLRAADGSYEIVGIVSSTSSTGSLAYEFDAESSRGDVPACPAAD